jgi:hypothetical protein
MYMAIGELRVLACTHACMNACIYVSQKGTCRACYLPCQGGLKQRCSWQSRTAAGVRCPPALLQ